MLDVVRCLRILTRAGDNDSTHSIIFIEISSATEIFDCTFHCNNIILVTIKNGYEFDGGCYIYSYLPTLSIVLVVIQKVFLQNLINIMISFTKIIYITYLR